MTVPRETAYPHLQEEPSANELDLYTPSRKERNFAESEHPTRAFPRYALLLQLKTFQHLGRFVPTATIPEPIRQHIAKACELAKFPTLTELRRYDESNGRRVAMQALRAHLKVRPVSKEKDEGGQSWLDTIAETAAETKDNLPDIINVMLEELVHHRYELPAFSTLDRCAFAAREKVNSRHYASIASLLSRQAKSLIDEMLKTANTSDPSSMWNTIKREPKRPTGKEVRSYLQHIQQLRHLAEQMPPVNIPVGKLRQYRNMARAADASEMAELKPAKRYALAVILIRSQCAQAFDDAGDLFVRLMRNLGNLAQSKLAQHQLDRYKVTDMLIEQLREVLLAFKLNGSATQRISAITDTLKAEVDDLIGNCDEHLAYAGRNHLPFLLQPYKSVRSQLFNCLEIMSPRTTSSDKETERMIGALMQLRGSRHDEIPLVQLGLDGDRDFQWMNAQWRKLMFVTAKSKDRPSAVQRRYFELAVLHLVYDELRSGDLAIEYGERYDDYREQLVDKDTFLRELGEYGDVTGLETDPSKFVARLKTELAELATASDQAFPKNAHAEFVDGRLVLRKLDVEEDDNDVKVLDQHVTDRMPSAGILDILVDVEGWLDLHKLFRPLAGTESRLDDPRSRFVTTLFCYGCNLGPTQTAKSIKGFNRRQIAWLNLKYVSEDNLDKALVKIINAYNKLEIPNYWGSGKHVSADGTKWTMYDQNLMSEYHIRYGGYGGIGYYHVSDKYIALFSHFIPCGVYEGLYLLDGLLANEPDIQPDTVHGDTHAQSFAIFALSYLLGIKLMPRIRGIKDLALSRPHRSAKYENIDSLFRSIVDWDLLEKHLPDMLRVVVSIKLGKITPSTILRRLGTHSRKNKLYFAFQELGKVIRTMFLLRFIGDPALRKAIHAETNKSEEYNGFAKWAFFGNEGVIAENFRHEQRKIVKYNQLVTNAVILHNVAAMTRVLADLRREGIAVTASAIAGLGPYRHGHINRLGDYSLNMRRKMEPLDFGLRIFDEKSTD